MSSNQIPTLEEFLAVCRAECEFLTQEYGFERLDSPMEYNDFSVRYRKGDLEVDLYGESWGQSASCDLVRGEDRLYLELLVPKATPEARKPATLGQLAQIRTLAHSLRLHASDFLREDFESFDSALAEWRQITERRPLTEARRLEREREQAVTAAGHASKRKDYVEVVRLLEPHAGQLSPHQRRMLEEARVGLEKNSDR